MRIVPLSEIQQSIDTGSALSAIESGYAAFSAGKVQVAAVTHLGFEDPPGDLHVKTGHIAGDDVYVVKIASGFYENSKLGLPVGNGMMILFSATTGAPIGILQDEGVLTDLRTALGGAIASRVGAREGSRVLGVIGTGVQAGLQAAHISGHLGLTEIVIWGRSFEKAEALAKRLSLSNPKWTVKAVASAEDACRDSDIIVTTTTAREPILSADWIQPGTHITAVGADAPGKQELDARILAAASHVIVDSIDQCVDHGEAASAIAQGQVVREDLVELGTVLAQGGRVARSEEDITVADLTGVAVQDVAIAKAVWERVAATGS